MSFFKDNVSSAGIDEIGFRRLGFTIIELLLVVSLLAVFVALAVPNLAMMHQGRLLNRVADDLAYHMRYAQSRAVTRNQLHQIQFDQSQEQYWIVQQTNADQGQGKSFERIKNRHGRIVVIPDGIKLKCESLAINFYPNGTIDKVRIFLNGDDASMIVSSMEQRGQIHVLNDQLLEK